MKYITWLCSCPGQNILNQLFGDVLKELNHLIVRAAMREKHTARHEKKEAQMHVKLHFD